MENRVPASHTDHPATAPLALLDMPLSDAEKQSATPQRETLKEKTPIIPVPADAPPCEFAIPDLGGKPTRLYPYHQANGALVGYIGRWNKTNPDTGETEKTILPICYCELPNGKRAWRSVGIPAPRPTYRLPDVLARPEAPILICEGEKAAEAAQELCPQFVATTPMHGAQSPHKTDWSCVKGRHVIISTDFDEAGDQFGDAVYDLCVSAGAASIMHLPAEMVGRRKRMETGFAPADAPAVAGYDLADALADSWTAEDIELLLKLVPLQPYIKASELKDISSKIGPSFRVSRYGVEYEKESKDKDGNVLSEWVWLCSYLAVTHLTRDGTGENWGRVLVIVDNDGKRHEYVLPMSQLAGDGICYREELLSRGLRLAPNGKFMLNLYISSANPKSRAICVPTCGWHGGCFILPDRVYGQKSGERIVLQQAIPAKPLPRKGTLPDWQQSIGTLCLGNSRLIVTVCLALTGPLLEPLGEENFGLHLEGASSIGKTTLLHVAASVWGILLQSWRTTDNAAEGLARAANDSFLILDELSQVDGAAADAMTYMLGNGAGKARAKRNGTARPVEQFRLVFLSSGETGLAAKMQENGKQAKAGQTVRFIEIPADAGSGHGVFEQLHGHADGNRLSIHLKQMVGEQSGSLADTFLKQLCTRRAELVERVATARREWQATHVNSQSDGQVMRVGHKFALVAAVGELAIELGLLPWPAGEASKACQRLFRDWIALRGGTIAHELREVETRLRSFIAEHGSARFETPWEKPETCDYAPKVINRAGFKNRTSAGIWEYFILPDVFKPEIIGSMDERTAKEHLAKRGLIMRDAQHKYTQSQRVPGYGQMRLYAIPPNVLEGGL